MLLTLVEHGQGALPQDSAAALRFARDLGAAHGIDVAAVALGEPEQLPKLLGEHGIRSLYAVRHELLAEHSPQLGSAALAALLDQLAPTAVLAPGNARCTELLAHTAARAELPLATNCLELSPGQPWRLTRVRGGGMLLEDAELDAPVRLCTLAQGAAEPAEPGADQEVRVESFTPELDEAAPRARLVERTEHTTGVTLATAPVVVSGGRGVGSAEGYAVLEELAGLLGGAIGCSRVATNSGWRSHSDQVGLTGTKIAPDLYIACGISGATQHWVGCMNAKTILAVNTDPDAPLVAKSHYSVIGDVHEVLPAVVEALRNRQA